MEIMNFPLKEKVNGHTHNSEPTLFSCKTTDKKWIPASYVNHKKYSCKCQNWLRLGQQINAEAIIKRY